MAPSQKRDSKGRFKSKPKDFDAPSGFSVPGKPAPATPKKSKKTAPKPKIRLVRNPVYEPVAAVRTMSEALEPVKDARSKRKRDKARKNMEATFGDIDWDEQTGNDTSAVGPSEQASPKLSTQSWDDESPLASSPDLETRKKDASSREELIAASGNTGEAWVKNRELNDFTLLASDVTMIFVYAEDSFTGDTPESFQGIDHIRLTGESFSKCFSVGDIAFLSHA